MQNDNHPEPVAWRTRWKSGSERDREWEMWTYRTEQPAPNDQQIIEPLYAASLAEGEPANEYFDMLWAWFEQRGAIVRADYSEGFSVDDFKTMLDEHEAALSGHSPAEKAAQDNLREAWSALSLIRETIETLGPVGALTASEHLDGPTFMHEAEALVQGIQLMALAGRSQPETASQREIAINLLGWPSPEKAAAALLSKFNITRKTTEEPRG
jgi:hypothetical protein